MGINCLQCKQFYEKETKQEITKEQQSNTIVKQKPDQPKRPLYGEYIKREPDVSNHNNNSLSYLSLNVVDINTLSNINISQKIFNKINDFRRQPDFFQPKAKDHALEQFFESIKTKLNTERDDCVCIWNEKKYSIADSQKEFDTNKYNVEYVSVPPLNFSNSYFSAEEVVWDILKKVTNEEREKIIVGHFDSFIVNAKYNNKVLNVELILLNKKTDLVLSTKI